MLVFHHSTPGDPITLAEPDGQNERQIYKGAAGEHHHYVSLSPDNRHVYFVRGWRSTEMDIWRIAVTGGTPERLTRHNSHVAYPVLLDNRTLIYRATAGDGTAWVLYGMDVERRIPHQISRGVEEYQSVSTSANGRRLAVTVSNPAVSLWTVPIATQIADESATRRVSCRRLRRKAHATRRADCCTWPARAAPTASGDGKTGRRSSCGVPAPVR